MSSISVLLQSKGVQDIFLQTDSIEPNNALLYRFTRQTSIAQKFIEICPSGNVAFGHKLTFFVPRDGDFVHKMFLQIKLPKLTKIDGTFACYVNSAGHALLEYVDVYIGDILIDHHQGHYLEIMSELAMKEYLNDGKDLSLGKVQLPFELQFFYANDAVLYIPLIFYFNRFLNMSLPIAALNYQDIRIEVKLRNFNEVITFDGSQPPLNKGIEMTLITQYLYVSPDVRRTIVKNNKTYIVEQTQSLPQPESINIDNINTSIEIPFNHPVKSIYWFLIEKGSIDNNDHFHFGNRSNEFQSIAKSFRLSMDNAEIIQDFPEAFYRLLFPSIVHTKSSNKHIYMYSFSNSSIESNQASGSFNFSASRKIKLETTLAPSIVSDHVYLYMYGLGFNVLKIENNLAKLLFMA